MWLSKPVYEALPYYNIALGAVALVASRYVDWWYWPAICLSIGVLGIGGGIIVLIQRRRHRREA